jgi:hypothetical protein
VVAEGGMPAGISSTCIRRSIAVKNSGRKILRSPLLTYAADHPGEDLPRFASPSR